MAAYEDSAIDYNFTVEYISVASNYMRVLYQSADSTDGRPDIRKNFRLEEFNDSAVLSTAKGGASAVVNLWNEALRNESDGAGFDPDSYPSLVFSERFLPIKHFPSPAYHPATQYLLETDTVTSECIERRLVPTAHDSDTLESFRLGLLLTPLQIRGLLEDAGKYDSAVSAILADSNDIEIEWEYLERFNYRDPLTPVLRSVLEFPSTVSGDSDWTDFLSKGMGDSQEGGY